MMGVKIRKGVGKSGDWWRHLWITWFVLQISCKPIRPFAAKMTYFRPSIFWFWSDRYLYVVEFHPSKKNGIGLEWHTDDLIWSTRLSKLVLTKWGHEYQVVPSVTQLDSIVGGHLPNHLKRSPAELPGRLFQVFLFLLIEGLWQRSLHLFERTTWLSKKKITANW